MNKRQRFLTVFTLGLLSALGPFSIDMYLPGFPDIARSLHTTVAQVSLSLSSFFIGISIGQLLYGPLLDKYGRKIPLYVGMVVYILTSIGCALVESADTLIVVRFFQALGGCAGMVASRALIRDIFPVEENAKVFSMLMLVIAVSPIVAPTLGGYITAEFGWHTIFLVLAVIAILTLLAVIYWLPDGRGPRKDMSLYPAPIIKGFWEVFKTPQFNTYAITGSIAASGLFGYLAGAPFVFMKLYQVSEKQFGWIFAIIAMGLVLASQLNTLLLRKYSSATIAYWALLCQSLAGIVFLWGALSGWLGLYSTIAIIWVFLSTQGFAFPNTSALSIAPFSSNAGTASALMGAIQMGIGAFTSAIVGLLNDKSILPMAAVMCACAIMSFTFLMIGRSQIRYEIHEDAAEQKRESAGINL